MRFPSPCVKKGAPATSLSPSVLATSPRWGFVALIVLGGFVAYANSFSVPFLFDDIPALVENPALRDPWNLGAVMFPEATAGGLSLSGRPVLALSFALNRAFGGEAVGGYHAVNLAIHLAAGLVLFGLMRLTLRRVPVFGRGGLNSAAVSDLANSRPKSPAPPGVAVGASEAGAGGAADLAALAVALLWTVHPLQTESVTYLVQRAESLAGFFYLLTLYGFARGAEAESSGRSAGRWWGVSVAACVLGLATKETVVTAPLMVWFYDRTFFAGSFFGALRTRGRFYAVLAATWLVLVALVLSTGGNRGGTVGFGVGVTPWAYALTQFEAVARYLWLAVCPHPLVFEYGTFWVEGAAEVLPFAVPVLALFVGTLWALWRRPVLGFAGAWFFGILAPTSLTPGTIQMIVEHRVYLSLAAVLAVGVVALYAGFGRRAWWLLGCMGVAYVAVTFARNADYRDELRLWQKTVDQRPRNAIALTNLGRALYRTGAVAEAVSSYERALEVNPRNLEAHFNLGLALVKQGRAADAVAHYEAALRLAPARVDILDGLGQALAAAGRLPEAKARYAEALRLAPNTPEPHNNLGDLLLQSGQVAEAVAEFETALRLRPDYPEALYNLGNARALQGNMPEAARCFERAVQARPSYVDARVNLGNALLALERIPAAAASYEAALRLAPRHADAHFNLGIILLNTGKPAEAAAHFEQAIAARPGFTEAQRGLTEAGAQLRR